MYKIQTITAGSAVASLDFTVPSGYDDLMIVTSVRSAQADVALEVFIAFNGSTSSFSARQLYGTGSSAATSTPARQVGLLPGANATASTFNSGTIYIPNYLGSTNKSYSVDSVTENNGTTAYQNIVAGLWGVTDPITSISLTTTDGNNFVQGSTATLFGIRKYNTTATPKATGGIITYADGYWYHAFTASGTFTPTQSISAEVVMVAGGGGGAIRGGGGAGGVLTQSASLTAQAYTVAVGAGGSQNGAGSSGSNGTNSTFTGLTNAVGGGGGGGDPLDGNSGGSGGGRGTGDGSGGTGTNGQGNPGGSISGYSGPNYRGGGGGGAGSAGANGGESAGTGGNGIAINYPMLTGAGGGGGGAGSQSTQAGGTYGGGTGGRLNASEGTNGSRFMGGGGGGAPGNGYNGGNGGSGIVIVRYAA